MLLKKCSQVLDSETPQPLDSDRDKVHSLAQKLTSLKYWKERTIQYCILPIQCWKCVRNVAKLHFHLEWGCQRHQVAANLTKVGELRIQICHVGYSTAVQNIASSVTSFANTM